MKAVSRYLSNIGISWIGRGTSRTPSAQDTERELCARPTRFELVTSAFGGKRSVGSDDGLERKHVQDLCTGRANKINFRPVSSHSGNGDRELVSLVWRETSSLVCSGNSDTARHHCILDVLARTAARGDHRSLEEQENRRSLGEHTNVRARPDHQERRSSGLCSVKLTA
jgi:hypothetical protein